MTPSAHTLLGAVRGPAVVVLDGPRPSGLCEEAHLPALRAGVQLVVPAEAASARIVVEDLGLPEIGVLARHRGAGYAIELARTLADRVRAASLLGVRTDGLARLWCPTAVWLDRRPAVQPRGAALDVHVVRDLGSPGVLDMALRFCAPT